MRFSSKLNVSMKIDLADVIRAIAFLLVALR